MIDLQVHLKKMSVYERWFVCFHEVIITTQSHFHRKKILNQSQLLWNEMERKNKMVISKIHFLVGEWTRKTGILMF